MKRVLIGSAVALLAVTQAGAGELITTADAARTPASASPAGVPPLDGSTPPADELAGPGARPGACPAAAEAGDRQPHGEVWGGVGSHGYRSVGTAVTVPVGKCSSVSIAVSRTQGGFAGWRR